MAQEAFRRREEILESTTSSVCQRLKGRLDMRSTVWRTKVKASVNVHLPDEVQRRSLQQSTIGAYPMKSEHIDFDAFKHVLFIRFEELELRFLAGQFR